MRKEIIITTIVTTSRTFDVTQSVQDIFLQPLAYPFLHLYEIKDWDEINGEAKPRTREIFINKSFIIEMYESIIETKNDQSK